MSTHRAELRAETVAAIAAVRHVLPIVLERRGAERVHAKGPNDLVTDTDLLVERTLQQILADRLPGIQFVGEEGGQALPNGGRAWLVDPVCGTENYAAGLPLYATNLALVENGQVTAAVVADGTTGEIYIAERGRGAYLLLGAQRVRLTATDTSQLLSLDPSPSAEPAFQTNLALRALASGKWNVRMLATSLVLPYLAAGRLAAAVYASSGVPVHFAAGLLLAEEAGARVSDAAGAAWDLHSAVYVVAASDALHQELLRLVQEVRD